MRFGVEPDRLRHESPGYIRSVLRKFAKAYQREFSGSGHMRLAGDTRCIDIARLDCVDDLSDSHYAQTKPPRSCH